MVRGGGGEKKIMGLHSSLFPNRNAVGGSRTQATSIAAFNARNTTMWAEGWLDCNRRNLLVPTQIPHWYPRQKGMMEWMPQLQILHLEAAPPCPSLLCVSRRGPFFIVTSPLTTFKSTVSPSPIASSSWAAASLLTTWRPTSC